MAKKENKNRIKGTNVWQKTHRLIFDIVQMNKFFREKPFGLCSQSRKSGGMVMVNIAEAFDGRRREDKVLSLTMARRALSESHYYLSLAHEQHYVNSGKLVMQAEKVAMLLELYIKTLRK